MRIEPEVSGASIVLIGSFNPAIFHPQWLFNHSIESPTPEDYENFDFVLKDVAKFTISGTTYFIDKNRFQIQTMSGPWIQVLDKIAMIFSELLPHTPIRAMGINRDVHFQVSSYESRMEIGRKLAPVEHWGKFGEEMNHKVPQLAGGMLSLTMRSIEDLDDFTINKNVRIEPSSEFTDNNGIYMQANFHYSSKNSDDSAIGIVTLLQNEFQKRINEAEEIFDCVMGLE